MNSNDTRKLAQDLVNAFFSFNPKFDGTPETYVSEQSRLVDEINEILMNRLSDGGNPNRSHRVDTKEEIKRQIEDGSFDYV